MSQNKDPLEILAKLEAFFRDNNVETSVKHNGDGYTRLYGKCKDGVQVHVTVLWGEST